MQGPGVLPIPSRNRHFSCAVKLLFAEQSNARIGFDSINKLLYVVALTSLGALAAIQ